MPAAAARSRPAAPDRFEMTAAIRASSRPSAIASISAWRLLPRPEMRTPSRSSIHDPVAACPDLADPHDAALAGRGQDISDFGGALPGARDDQADSHIEGPHHVIVRNRSGT